MNAGIYKSIMDAELARYFFELHIASEPDYLDPTGLCLQFSALSVSKNSLIIYMRTRIDE